MKNPKNKTNKNKKTHLIKPLIKIHINKILPKTSKNWISTRSPNIPMKTLIIMINNLISILIKSLIKNYIKSFFVARTVSSFSNTGTRLFG
jgi:hypothetical protein